MPNPFEKDWTKPEGHETEEQPPNGEKQRNVVSPTGGEHISPGNSGGGVFTLGTDGIPQLLGVIGWIPGKPSSAIDQRQQDLKRILETILSPIVGAGGHYHPQRFDVLPGNHQWNDGMGDKNYPRMSEEIGDLPEPDQVIVVERKKD